MKWGKLKDTVVGLAPTLAAALGGPIAGGAVKVLSNVLLGKDDGSEDELIAAISGATPDQLLALKKADQDYKSKMAELSIDLFELEVDDRKNARTSFKDDLSAQKVLAAVFITGYFVLLALMGIYPDFEIDPILIGVMAASVQAIMQFFYGSSAGSKLKTLLQSEVSKS